MHYTYALCMSAQLLVMSDHSLAWSDIVSDHAKRIIMHTDVSTTAYACSCINQSLVYSHYNQQHANKNDGAYIYNNIVAMYVYTQ